MSGAYGPGYQDLPSFEDLTAGGPERDHRDVVSDMNQLLGIGTPRERWQDPDRADVSDLRDELGI
jgi:hypothetical protein